MSPTRCVIQTNVTVLYITETPWDKQGQKGIKIAGEIVLIEAFILEQGLEVQPLLQ